MTPAYSLYFHVPFCVHRCAYCDFNTYAGQEEMIPAYVEALSREAEFVGSSLSQHEGAEGSEEFTRSFLAAALHLSSLQSISRRSSKAYGATFP